MALSWSARRQFLYYIVAIIILAILAVFVWLTFFNKSPNCFDGVLNGSEVGIDCGGSCALVCKDLAKDPTVLWSRAFPTGASSYTIAAYLQNNNVSAGAKSVPYSFQLFDDKNSLVKEQRGTVDIPPIHNVPIVVPNVNVGNRTVSKVLFGFANEPVGVWNKVNTAKLPVLRVAEQSHADDWSRLSSTITNDSISEAKKVTVVAVLFDADNVARAASKSVISSIPGHSSQTVTFTWPFGVVGVVRGEVTIVPNF
jgi:hypothetical protein